MDEKEKGKENMRPIWIALGVIGLILVGALVLQNVDLGSIFSPRSESSDASTAALEAVNETMNNINSTLGQVNENLEELPNQVGAVVSGALGDFQSNKEGDGDTGNAGDGDEGDSNVGNSNYETEAIVFVEADVPLLDDEQSQSPEAGYGSYDLGVNEDQVGLVFGVHVLWPAGNSDAGGEGCDMVVLNPGFYPDLQIADGRYEIYTLPELDHDGWRTSLATLRVQEQKDHYECPDDMGHVLVWSADPHEETWRNRRRASGVDFLIEFYEGDTVYGFSVYRGEVTYVEDVGHEGELLCDGGGCYLPQATFDGWCGGCTVNTWWDEIPKDAAAISTE